MNVSPLAFQDEWARLIFVRFLRQSLVLSYDRRGPTSTTALSTLPASKSNDPQTSTTTEDFGWKDVSKKGKKGKKAAAAAYQPSEDAIARFEKRQAEREKALVKAAKVRLGFLHPRWMHRT